MLHSIKIKSPEESIIFGNFKDAGKFSDDLVIVYFLLIIVFPTLVGELPQFVYIKYS